MISVNNLTLMFGSRILFEEVNAQFIAGNCYGLIGANGSGKSTFVQIMAGELEATSGEVFIDTGERLAVLKQNQFEFDQFDVMTTVIKGYPRLSAIMIAKEALYEKVEMTEEEGLELADLEAEFADLDGWTAESEAAQLLQGLGISEKMHEQKMSELEGSEKVRVLLAQALFGDPDILLLDEPTNHLDLESITWLEDFLLNFRNTVIVVSHDRHFLDKVCTHIADIDFGKIQLFSGNYRFWYESSQLALKQARDQNKKSADKVKELKAFISKFSANASKAKQATSRKKLLDKITIHDLKPSSRKYPHIVFPITKKAGSQLLNVEELTASVDGVPMFANFEMEIVRGEKIAFIGKDTANITAFFQTIMGLNPADSGSFKWGASIKHAYYPKDNREYFENVELNLIQWLAQYSDDKDENFIRSFLGKMLFSGDEALKQAKVLSGGEKVRCMLAKMMITGANVLIFNEPTNHLDLESITALNNALVEYPGTILFHSHDHTFIQTVATRIIELGPTSCIDRAWKYDDYLANEDIIPLREQLYA